jgi:hypothetical protein
VWSSVECLCVDTSEVEVPGADWLPRKEFSLTTSKEMLAAGSEVSLIRMSRGVFSLVLPGVRQFCAEVIYTGIVLYLALHRLSH